MNTAPQQPPDRCPVLGSLVDGGGLALLRLDDLRVLRAALRLLGSELGRRDGGVPAHLAVLQATLDRVYEKAKLQARVPRPEHRGTFGTPPTPLADSLNAMDIDEVAKLLDCSTRNVRALAGRGSLSGRKQANRWTFDRLSVLELLESRRAS